MQYYIYKKKKTGHIFFEEEKKPGRIGNRHSAVQKETRHKNN